MSLQRLAAFAAALDARDLPAEVLDKAKACLLYGLAVGVAAARTDAPARVARALDRGSGPVHAADLARALDIRRVLVPPAAGLFSAFGLLRAEVEHHAARTVLVPSDEADPAAIGGVLDAMRADLVGRAGEEGFPAEAVACAAFVDLRYAGQSSEITVPLPSLAVTAETLRGAEQAFEAEFERTYGHRGERKRFELVNCRVVATVARGGDRPMRWATGAAPGASPAAREVHFGPQLGTLRTPILTRAALGRESRPGPAIVEEYDSTIVVPPDARVSRDDDGNVLLELG